MSHQSLHSTTPVVRASSHWLRSNLTNGRKWQLLSSFVSVTHYISTTCHLLWLVQHCCHLQFFSILKMMMMWWIVQNGTAVLHFVVPSNPRLESNVSPDVHMITTSSWQYFHFDFFAFSQSDSDMTTSSSPLAGDGCHVTGKSSNTAPHALECNFRNVA